MPDVKPSTTFRIGDLVRVKHGVTDVDYPDIPMGGWLGNISKVADDSYLVEWTIETLENVHPVYRKRCERDGVDYEEYWVHVSTLEPASDEPLYMEQPTTIITRPLSADRQDDRICMVFALTSDDPLPYDSEAAELTYFNFLKSNLTFPFPAQSFDPTRNHRYTVTVVGMSDSCPIDDGFGVVCDVLNAGKKKRMPLLELSVDPGDINHQMVNDYITWFVNAPDDRTSPFSDEWGPNLLGKRK